MPKVVDKLHYTAALSSCTMALSWPYALAVLRMLRDALLQADVVLYLGPLFPLLGLRFPRKPFEAHKGTLFIPRATLGSRYSSAISVLGGGAKWPHAVQLFWSLGGMRMASDITAVTAAMRAYATGSRWQACAWLLAHASGADRVACTTAISSCEKAQRWEAALAFFAAAGVRSVRKDAAMYNATIASIASSSQAGLGWLGVLSLLHDMALENIKKSTTTLNSALTAMERAACWEWALSLFRDLPRASLAPDVISYNATMTSFEKESRWDRVLSLLKEARTLRLADGISDSVVKILFRRRRAQQ